MDKDFNKNQLKPGDTDFVYDKVVDFSKDKGAGDALSDDSWGEDDGIGEAKQDDDAEYYDEEQPNSEDEDEAANAALANAMKNR